MQQTVHYICGVNRGHSGLKFANFEAHENHIYHETQGLSRKQLVVRRGKPFKLTLMFDSQLLFPHNESLILEVCLGDIRETIPVQFSDKPSSSQCWSAIVYPGHLHLKSVTIHICSPVLSSVGLYRLLVHIGTRQKMKTYTLGTFVLLCNPWLKDDPVYMPLDVQTEEYVKSDYGLVYTGTLLNISRLPWSFGQYEPGVLETCLQLLQVSPQHLQDKNKDYILRADPVYLSRVICAMVNCNDDLGIILGKWQGSYKGGVKPTEWSGSAEILHRWVSSGCSPVRYGQCWVFASVLCTVMRVFGIPSRVVTVFNAAHDTNANLKIEEFYSSTGEKLHVSKDSIWNFHVWVECWMRRPDLGAEFDGWQVVDPTPQEKSAGIFCCGPCPVAAIKQHCLRARFDAPFLYACVDADVTRLIVHNGTVVERTVDNEHVGQLIYTKSIGSDRPENLTQTYKGKIRWQSAGTAPKCGVMRAGFFSQMLPTLQSSPFPGALGGLPPSSLEVSLNVDASSSVGNSIVMCVMITNQSSSPRVLREHLSAQLKDYNSSPQESFWKSHRELHIQPGEVLKLHHTIPPSDYESVLAADDIVNLAVVVEDVRTKERVLAAQEFGISSQPITIEVEGGDSIQMKKEHTAQVSFMNTFTKTLTGAVLTVQGYGLMQGAKESRLIALQPNQTMEMKVTIIATTPGTKTLKATFSHSKSPNIVSKSFHKVSVMMV